jgi:hypothetical protein
MSNTERPRCQCVCTYGVEGEESKGVWSRSGGNSSTVVVAVVWGWPVVKVVRVVVVVIRVVEVAVVLVVVVEVEEVVVGV